MASDRSRPWRRAAEALVIPIAALAAAMVVFGIFMAALGQNPLEIYALIYKGAFASAFSWQNTLSRAAPLVLTALCVALPAQAGLMVIGGEGAVVLGGLAAAIVGHLLSGAAPTGVKAAMVLAGMVIGGVWIALAGALRQYRGVNETISSLLLTYVAVALFNHFVEGPLRDPSSLNKPSTASIGDVNMIGSLPGLDVHWGLGFGLVFCAAMHVLVRYTTYGFALRIVGGNPRAARLAGLPVARLVLPACAPGGPPAGLAGGARRGGGSRRGPRQRQRVLDRGLRLRRDRRRVHRPPESARDRAGGGAGGRPLGVGRDAPAPARSAGRDRARSAGHRVHADPRQRSALRPAHALPADGLAVVELGWWGVPIGVLGGAIRVSTPFLFVSLGECITERSGRINLGLEGILIMGAMSGYAVSYTSGNPWLGVLAAGGAGLLL